MQQHLATHPSDRPLIVQLAGNDPARMLQAARIVENSCDGKDYGVGRRRVQTYGIDMF